MSRPICSRPYLRLTRTVVGATVLALALVLSAAAAHQHSHAVGGDHCELCLQIGSAAPLTSSGTTALEPQAPDVVRTPLRQGLRTRLDVFAYLSRGPPRT